jgi:hypothetical protein
MNKLLTVVAIASLLSGFAHAGTLPDYSDKTNTCDKEEIQEELAIMIKNSAAGIQRGVRLLYIKGEPVEVSRKSDELRCRIEIATTSRYPTKGIFYYRVEDGHSLVGWQSDPYKTK